jgi:hypothetical protein
MVLNVGRRENAKGYWALWMILNIEFRRMTMDIGLWVKAVSLLLDDLEASTHRYDARCMNDML